MKIRFAFENVEFVECSEFPVKETESRMFDRKWKGHKSSQVIDLNTWHHKASILHTCKRGPDEILKTLWIQMAYHNSLFS